MYPILIPPIPELEHFAREQQFQLVLSHLLVDPTYKAFMQSVSASSYIILDNSAHELTEGEAIEQLLCQAEEIGASEIVIPDHLFSLSKTLKRARQSFMHLRKLVGRTSWENIPNLMVVPQGTHINEWSVCLWGLLESFDEFLGPKASEKIQLCIGISKDYESFGGGLETLFQHYLSPLHDQRPELQFHCLGWGRDLWALDGLAYHYPWIRSVDSAKPFVYAMYGKRLFHGMKYPPYPKRPKDFFYRELSPEKRKLAEINAEVFELSAGGQYFQNALGLYPAHFYSPNPEELEEIPGGEAWLRPYQKG